MKTTIRPLLLLLLLAACSSSAGTDVVLPPDTERGADTTPDLPGTDGPTDGQAEAGPELPTAPDLTEIAGELPGTPDLAEVVPQETVEAPDLLPDLPDPADLPDLLPETVEETVEDVPPELPPSILIAYISTPSDGAVVKAGTPVTFEAFLEDTVYPAAELSAAFASDVDGPLWSGSPDANGYASFTTDTLSPGQHKITLTAASPSGEIKEPSIKLGICTEGEPETFDEPITGLVWKTFGDAFWDPGGFLDMTGNVGDKQGAIFNVAQKVNPGDVTISFKIQTGPNVGNGADGFAMTVYDAESVTELEALIAAAHGGGGLAYAVSGPYGPAVIDALHVEIDTWYNQYNGTSELHTDPTSENHIAVCLNGDAGNCPLWAAVPNIEDMAWHDVAIQVEGYHIIVTLDGTTVLDDDIPGFEFRGGYIGFTGSTGYYSNYHRFDDLLVVQACIVP